MRKDKTIEVECTGYADCSLSDFNDQDVIDYAATLPGHSASPETVEIPAQAAYVAYCQRDEAQELLLGRELVGELLGRILGGIPGAVNTNNAKGQSCKPSPLN